MGEGSEDSLAFSPNPNSYCFISSHFSFVKTATTTATARATDLEQIRQTHTRFLRFFAMNSCPPWSPNAIHDASTSPNGQLNIQHHPTDEQSEKLHGGGDSSVTTHHRHHAVEQNLHRAASATASSGGGAVLAVGGGGGGGDCKSTDSDDSKAMQLPIQMQQGQAKDEEDDDEVDEDDDESKGGMSPYSVLIGRGNEVKNWVGNKRLEILCQTQLEAYANAKNKVEKSEIVSSIKDMVLNAGGSFYKKKAAPSGNVSEETWQLTTRHQAAREKIGSLLRDMLYYKYRSSSKSKVSERRRVRLSSASSIPQYDPQVLFAPQGSIDDDGISSGQQQPHQQPHQHRIQDQQLRQLMNMSWSPQQQQQQQQQQRPFMAASGVSHRQLIRTGSVPGYFTSTGGSIMGGGGGDTTTTTTNTNMMPASTSPWLPMNFNVRHALSEPTLTTTTARRRASSASTSSSVAAYVSRAQALMGTSRPFSSSLAAANAAASATTSNAGLLLSLKHENVVDEDDYDDDDKSQMSDFDTSLVPQQQQGHRLSNQEDVSSLLDMPPPDESTFDNLF